MPKNNIEVKVIIDTRERDISYLKDLLDVRIKKDGIKLKESEVKTCKPDGCKLSTGDITIEYRIKDSDEEWIKTKLCIELKKGGDNFSSIYLKANRDRLFREIGRAKEYGLDFYYVILDDMTETSKKIKKIPKFRNKNVNVTYFNNYLKLEDELRNNGFRSPIISGNDLAWTIKRIIKQHIKEHKLQYSKK